MGERMKQYQDPAEIAPPQKSAREYRIYPALIERCAELEPVSTAVAHPCDESSLTAAIEAAEADLIRPVLVAPENKIRSVAEQFGLDIRPKIPSTIDAAALCKMAERGQITGGLLDGPLAFDNAISKEAAEIKRIRSEVAGDADILVVPDLEAGNMLAKQLSFLANADAAGIVLGARVPIILTSRADTVRARMASCAVAVLLVHARRHPAAE
jgi:phosphotransacetylase